MAPPAGPPVSPLEERAREFWSHFDVKDHRALVDMMTQEAMETDDLAQRWLHGQAAIEEHFARMGKRYEDSHTRLEDVTVNESPETAVLTCVVHYQMRWDGQPGEWRWPTTMIFVRKAGEWRIALVHTK
jgi:ketosteroid isomerase-like protein